MFGSTGQSRGIDMLSHEGEFAKFTEMSFHLTVLKLLVHQP